MGSKQKPENELAKFVWKRNPDYDISLLYETESKNPFAFNNPKPTWLEIAKVLQDGPLKMKVTDRSCRERVMELLKTHRKEESVSSQASGIAEEEMTAFKKLITSVAKLQETKPNKQLKNLYSKKDRAEGEAVRSNVLQEILRREEQEVRDSDLAARKRQSENSKENNDDDGHESDDDDFEFGPSKKGKFGRTDQKKDLINFLEKKSANENNLREEELRIRKKEMENKAAEVDIMRSKAEAEIEERKKMAELREKEMVNKSAELEIMRSKAEAEIEERKKMTEFLVKLATSAQKE